MSEIASRMVVAWSRRHVLGLCRHYQGGLFQSLSSSLSLSSSSFLLLLLSSWSHLWKVDKQQQQQQHPHHSLAWLTMMNVPAATTTPTTITVWDNLDGTQNNDKVLSTTTAAAMTTITATSIMDTIWFMAVPKKKVTKHKKRLKSTLQHRIPLRKDIIVDPRTGETTRMHRLPFNWKDYLVLPKETLESNESTAASTSTSEPATRGK